MIDMLSYKFFFLKIPVWGTSLTVPVVKTLHFLCRGLGSIPSQRSNIPHAVGGQEKRKEKHSPTESNILKFWFRINEFR